MLKGKNSLKKQSKLSEPDADMTEMLEFSLQESKIITINMIRTLVGNIDDTQEQIGNVSRERKQRDGNSKK